VSGPVPLPAAVELEERLVASVLEMPHLFPKVPDTLKAEAFYATKPRMVWAGILRCVEAGRPIADVDVMGAIRDAMGAERWLHEAQAVEAYLRSLFQVATTADVARDARRILGRAARRKMIAVAKQIAAEGLADETEDEAFLADAQGLLTGAATDLDVGGTDTCRRLGDLIRGHFQRMKEDAETGRVRGIGTGLASLDEIMGGWREQKVVIVGARPGMGKSAFMSMAAIEATLDETQDDDVASLVFSAEMSGDDVGIRALATEAKVDNRKVQDGRLSAQDWTDVTQAAAWLNERPVWVDDKPRPSLAYVQAKLRRLNYELSRKRRTVEVMVDGKPEKRERVMRVRVVIIDYVQLMTPPKNKEKDTEASQLKAIADGLKSIAKEERCTVIGLAQLNRDVETRTNKRPIIKDLKGSGGLEEAADTILFLYRDEYYDRNSQAAGLVEIDVAKQRGGGKTGRTVAGFDASFTRFRDLDPAELDDAKRRCGFGQNE
jgi:replicative DNA helicase